MLHRSHAQHLKRGSSPFVVTKLIGVTTVAAVAALVASVSAVPAAAQVTVTAVNGNLYQTTGLSSSSTNGGQMDGMLVTATFVGGATETRSWADILTNTGGVTGTGWAVSNTGATTYDAGSWLFSNTSGVGITSLVFDGAPGNTIFDRTFGGVEGTPSSSLGLDFAVTSGLSGSAVHAEYSNRLRVGTADPVGDLYTTLSVLFNTATTGFASGNTMRFSADTDNAAAGAVITAAAPEPGTLSLLGMGLMTGAGTLGAAARRRRQQRSK